jgi:hypothetical protein
LHKSIRSNITLKLVWFVDLKCNLAVEGKELWYKAFVREMHIVDPSFIEPISLLLISLLKGLPTSWFSRLLSSLLSPLLCLISLSSIKSLSCFCLNLFVVVLLHKGLVIELLGRGLLIISSYYNVD